MLTRYLDEEHKFVVIDGAVGASESNRAVLCIVDILVICPVYSER